MCIVYSGATKYIARDWVSYVEYRQIVNRSRDIKVENEASMEVLGLDAYKLDLWGGHTLYLHNVLYDLKIWRNLLYVVTLSKLSFHIVFENNGIFLF